MAKLCKLGLAAARPPDDPRVLRAIVDLERQGWTGGEVADLFGFSPRTLARRRARIRALRRAGRRGD